ncbi:hypothetical protein [Kribbella sp. NPDC051770]|uniref:hypothetical protein n=1 Tax=Kribbella sp. NPDC051770 TaxID=3155413 RepID=UPI00341D2C1B
MGVRLEDRGPLAHYAQWAGRRAGKVLAGIEPTGGVALLFAADELLVDGERVKFRAVPRVDRQDELLELEYGAGVVVTSDMGAAVAALAMRYRLDGRCAEFDVMTPRPFGDVPLVAGCSFETAAPLLFQPVRWSPAQCRSWGPGGFETTSGFFRLMVPERTIYTRPRVSVSGVDLDVVLYDDCHVELSRSTGVDAVTAHPPEWSTCYLTVASPEPYRIATTMTLDTPIFPGPHQEIETLPKWWADPPPLVLTDKITRYLYEHCPGEGAALCFETCPDQVEAELIDRSGRAIRHGLPLDTTDLEAGWYVVQLTRREAGVLPVRLVPPLRLPILARQR